MMQLRLSYSSGIAAFLVLSSCAFSVPVRRLAALVTNDGIFEKALQLGDITNSTAYAAKVANMLSSDPRICAPVLEIINELVASTNDPTGVNTIADRAVVGARKLLGFQNDGDQGLVEMMSGLADGSYDAHVLTALQEAMQNPPKTLASLQTYKYLVDTQAALLDLSTTVAKVDGNSSIAAGVTAVLPALQNVEAIIDKIGADFSVQNLVSQGVDIQSVLTLLEASQGNVTALSGENKSLASAITAATTTAITAMQNLATSAQSAAAIAASSTPVVPTEMFTQSPGPGTACS